jgi:putative oxidoreductase
VKTATVIARILLGLVFVIFGSNFFLNFIPMPPPPPGLAGDYFKVFAASGYMYVVPTAQPSAQSESPRAAQAGCAGWTCSFER